MNIDFFNTTVIVTGANRGIGAAIVKSFQQCNAEIIATCTNSNDLKRLNRVSKENKTKYFHLDFTSNESVQNFLESINKLKEIDVLINNAGVNKIDTIHEIRDDDWDWINTINLRGPFLMTREISKVMKKQGSGKIVNIASIFSVVSKTKRAAYATSKWGLVGFTKSVALDLVSDNILVNVVSPGFVDTELTRRILSKDELKKLIRTIHMKRMANADEISKIVLFLSSDQNSYITGQNIIVDGGFTSA